MSYKRIKPIVMLILSGLCITAAAAPREYPVRMAYYCIDDVGGLPDDFMKYAAGCGYNYIIVYINSLVASSGAQDWVRKDGTYNLAWAKTHPSLYTRLKDLFERADRCGLRFIPGITTAGAAAAENWFHTNANMGENKGDVVYAGDGKIRHYRCPLFIEEPDGMDKSVESYLGVVKEAFNDAKPKLSYSTLDFVHLGQDEMYALDNQLIVGHWNADEQKVLTRYQTETGDGAAACYRLMAEQTARRVNQVKKIFPGTRTTFWADMWDPELNGGTLIDGKARFKVWTSTGLVDVETRHVAERPELNSVKADMVLIPWIYSTTSDGRKPYVARNTLRHFKKNGFQVIIGTGYIGDQPAQIADSRKMLTQWVAAANLPDVSGAVAGFCVTWWLNPGEPESAGWFLATKPPRFLVYPELAHKAGFHP